MSSVLGPVHHWMYHKIELEEELLAALGKKALEEGWTDEEALREEGIGEALPSLEEIVDPDNVHGSIQGAMERTESRLADFVSSILEKNPERLPVLVETAKDFGRAHAAEKGGSAEDVFRSLGDVLLNGMPCDSVNTVTEDSADSLSWEQTEDLHERYWNHDGRSVGNYYALRNAVTEGMLEGTGFALETEDKDHYRIVRSA